MLHTEVVVCSLVPVRNTVVHNRQTTDILVFLHEMIACLVNIVAYICIT